MIIEEYKSKCPQCGYEQPYYRAITGGKHPPPERLKNLCAECAHPLRQSDITNWDEIEERIKGAQGWDGIP